VIRTKEPDRRLFYLEEELYRPARTNFYVRLNLAVGSWKELCSPLNAAFSPKKNGCPVDPAVYFKIFLVGYLENIVFDTDLAERVADSLAIREFLGYGPTERLPDHASLSRVRAAFAKDGLLEQVLEKTVALCHEAGLVSGEEAAVDSTLVPANASLSSLRCVKTGVGVAEHMQRQREAGRPVTASNLDLRSRSDPDARIAQKGAGSPRGMYYKASCLTDSRCQVILSCQALGADVSDSDAARPVLERAEKTLRAQGLSLARVVGDAGYDDSDLHAFVEGLGAEPVTNFVRGKSGKPEGFRKEDFLYDEARDLYLCPLGKELERRYERADGVYYQANPLDCEGCPFRASCLSKEAKRRTVVRLKNEQARERNIARCHTDEGRAALRRRKAVVEPVFSHMKRLGGLGRLNCRGLSKADAKLKVGSIAWNLLKLAKTVDPGRLLALFRRLFSPGRNSLAGFSAL